MHSMRKFSMSKLQDVVSLLNFHKVNNFKPSQLGTLYSLLGTLDQVMMYKVIYLASINRLRLEDFDGIAITPENVNKIITALFPIDISHDFPSEVIKFNLDLLFTLTKPFKMERQAVFIGYFEDNKTSYPNYISFADNWSRLLNNVSQQTGIFEYDKYCELNIPSSIQQPEKFKDYIDSLRKMFSTVYTFYPHINMIAAEHVTNIPTISDAMRESLKVSSYRSVTTYPMNNGTEHFVETVLSNPAYINDPAKLNNLHEMYQYMLDQEFNTGTVRECSQSTLSLSTCYAISAILRHSNILSADKKLKVEEYFQITRQLIMEFARMMNLYSYIQNQINSYVRIEVA